MEKEGKPQDPAQTEQTEQPDPPPEIEIEWKDQDDYLLTGEQYEQFKDIFARFYVPDSKEVSPSSYKNHPN